MGDYGYETAGCCMLQVSAQHACVSLAYSWRTQVGSCEHLRRGNSPVGVASLGFGAGLACPSLACTTSCASRRTDACGPCRAGKNRGSGSSSCVSRGFPAARAFSVATPRSSCRPSANGSSAPVPCPSSLVQRCARPAGPPRVPSRPDVSVYQCLSRRRLVRLRLSLRAGSYGVLGSPRLLSKHRLRGRHPTPVAALGTRLPWR